MRAKTAEIQTPLSRRSFLSRVASVTAPLILPSGVLGIQGRAGANDRVVTGHIGLGYRGRMLLERLHQGAGALCEVDAVQLERAAPLAGARARHYRDYREVLDRNDIDAVVIATPDHWHGLMAVHACEAGKDVYVETPACKTLEEGAAMLAAARRYGVVVQVGAPGPLTQAGRAATALMTARGGLLRASAWGEPNPTGGDRGKTGPPPSSLEWERWLGPAAWKPYNPDMVHSNFRWMLDFGGGQVCHQGDHCFALLTQCLSAPVARIEVEATGVVPLEGLWDCPTQLSARYVLQPGGVTLEWRQERQPGQPAFGLTLHAADASVTIAQPDERAAISQRDGEAGSSAKEMHAEDVMDDWLRCIATRETPAQSLERGTTAAAMCGLANLSRQLGRKLTWDIAQSRFVDDPQADRLRGALGREGWRL